MYNLTVLYAEDDPQSRNNYAFVLEEYFSKVYIAEDGREALSLYNKYKPDVLLLDISMPYIDGLEVAKTVREKNQDVPIIMLTAHSEQDILLRALNIKLEKYLLKPINDEELRKVIFDIMREIKGRDTIVIKENLSWNKINSNLFYGEKNIKLTKKEHKFITLLLTSVGEYFMHDTLILNVWDDEVPNASHDNKLHQLVYRLNKKINKETNINTLFIENSYTLGYRIKSDI